MLRFTKVLERLGTLGGPWDLSLLVTKGPEEQEIVRGGIAEP